MMIFLLNRWATRVEWCWNQRCDYLLSWSIRFSSNSVKRKLHRISSIEHVSTVFVYKWWRWFSYVAYWLVERESMLDRCCTSRSDDIQCRCKSHRRSSCSRRAVCIYQCRWCSVKMCQLRMTSVQVSTSLVRLTTDNIRSRMRISNSSRLVETHERHYASSWMWWKLVDWMTNVYVGQPFMCDVQCATHSAIHWPCSTNKF
jgi:hypothetical protein